MPVGPIRENRRSTGASIDIDRGVENEVPIDDQTDIGVLDEDGNYLYLRKHRIDASESEIVVQVDGRPAKAGIDPLDIIIDRKSKDNVIQVKAG